MNIFTKKKRTDFLPGDFILPRYLLIIQCVKHDDNCSTALCIDEDLLLIHEFHYDDYAVLK